MTPKQERDKSKCSDCQGSFESGSCGPCHNGNRYRQSYKVQIANLQAEVEMSKEQYKNMVPRLKIKPVPCYSCGEGMYAGRHHHRDGAYIVCCSSFGVGCRWFPSTGPIDKEDINNFITAWNTRPSPWIPITPDTMPKRWKNARNTEWFHVSNGAKICFGRYNFRDQMWQSKNIYNKRITDSATHYQPITLPEAE